MRMDGSTGSAADDAALQKLLEACQLYEDYLAVRSVAESATLRDLATKAVSEDSYLDHASTRRHEISVQKDSYVQALRSATADTDGLVSGDVRNGSC